MRGGGRTRSSPPGSMPLIWVMALGATLLVSFVRPAAGADPMEARAVRVIQKLGLDRNLELLGGAAAEQTTTYQIIVRNKGAAEAHLMLTRELDAAIPRYRDQWDRNMAAAYLDHLTIDQMESVAEKGRQSPFVRSFMSAQADIDADMQARSTGLLKDMLTAVLLKMFKEITPK